MSPRELRSHFYAPVEIALLQKSASMGSWKIDINANDNISREIVYQANGRTEHTRIPRQRLNIRGFQRIEQVRHMQQNTNTNTHTVCVLFGMHVDRFHIEAVKGLIRQ